MLALSGNRLTHIHSLIKTIMNLLVVSSCIVLKFFVVIIPVSFPCAVSIPNF